jgi:hypothetical protein
MVFHLPSFLDHPFAVEAAHPPSARLATGEADAY